MESVKRVLKGILLFLLSVTWCVLQTVVGAFVALSVFPKARFQKYRGMITVYHAQPFTLSLGTFAFVSDGGEHPRDARGRMYGHYVQSLILGPLFLLVVSLSQALAKFPPIKKYRAERDKSPEDIFVNRQAAGLQALLGE